MRAWRYTMKTLRIRSQLTVADPLQAERLLKALRIILEHQEDPNASSLLTNGVSFLQTTKIIVLTAPIVMVMPFLHTGCKRAPLLPETEEPMITIEFITALFYEVDEQLRP